MTHHVPQNSGDNLLRGASERRLLRMIDNMPVAVMTVDPVSYEITYANETSIGLIRQIEHLLPITADELIGTSIDVFHKNPSHQRRILSDAANLPYNARINLGPEMLDLKVSAVTASDGRYLGPMLTWAIVTKEVKAERRIQHLAHFDILTGLANRVKFNDEVAKHLKQHDEGATLLYVGLDGFKLVNDASGRQAGDNVLRVVANRLREIFSDADSGTVIGRVGGDEFGVLISGNDIANAKRVSDRVIQAIRSTYSADLHRRITTNASIGIAASPDHGTNSDEILARAELAMYAAKAEGKGKNRVFSHDMEDRINQRLCLQTQLNDSLHTDDGLFVYYQPIIDPLCKKITCREALIRWHLPAMGWISPAKFIPVAEQSDLIDHIGAFVLHRACQEAATWDDNSSIAVNVSANQLGKGTIVSTVQSALGAAGLDVSRLEIEVTETAILGNEDSTLQDLLELHEMGVRIALDDFGTGYSSLTHLCSFPYDKIKIDGSFVKDAIERPEAAAIVRAVADLGRRIGVTTVAEGVETEAHLQRVLQEGCSEVQGYYFGKPRPAAWQEDAIARLSQEENRRAT